MSTQLRPLQKMENARTGLIKDAKPDVNWIGKDTNTDKTYNARMVTESQASPGKVHVMIAPDTELFPAMPLAQCKT